MTWLLCMLTTKNFEMDFLAGFDSIDLAVLNQKAPMLVRLDNKYIIRERELALSIPLLTEYFDVLQIDNGRVFTYNTCYFDDEELNCYFDHHRGRRQRIKIRTRKYCDTNMCFVEAKLKDVRGATIKKRLPYHVEKYGFLDDEAMEYVAKVQQDLYQKNVIKQLRPTLEMSYQRTTLVAKSGGERVTIDRNMRFYSDNDIKKISADVCIVETKSANANGIADVVLRYNHLHPTNNCSKYCLGMCVTDQVKKMNNFMPALRKLGVLPFVGNAFAFT